MGRWLSDFEFLERLLDDHVEYGSTAPTSSRLAAKLWPEDAAEEAREAFGLDPSEPVRDVCGLLEANGIKVRTMRIASPEFFGLSVAPVDGGPAIVVNTWERIPVERGIFTAAHELGHLILHLDEYDVAETDEPERQEQEANTFAAAFLMPEDVFWREWNDAAGLPFVDRVLKVKRMFHVSYRTVLYRLHRPTSDPGNVWRRFQSDHARMYGRTLLRSDEPKALAHDAFRASFPEDSRADEPSHLHPSDFAEDRLSLLVRRAVEDGHISLGRAAEILGHSLTDMRHLANSWVG